MPRPWPMSRRSSPSSIRAAISKTDILLVPPPVSFRGALASRVIGVLAPPASLARWGIAKFPTCLDCGSDDFLCGCGTSERFDDRVNQKWGMSSAMPTLPASVAPWRA
jgi:hypothetical protein